MSDVELAITGDSASASGCAVVSGNCGPGRDTVRADRYDRLIGCEVVRRS